MIKRLPNDPVLLQAVATRAGVSIATASRALTGARQVRPDLAQAVRTAADELGYRANHVARSLRRQQTLTFGMVVPHIANPFFPRLVQAVELALRGRGYEFFLCDSRDDPEIELQRVHALIDRSVDGLILVPCRSTSSGAAEFANERVPVVMVDRRVNGAACDFVATDHAHGIASGVSLLTRCRRTDIAFVGAAASMSSAQERVAAYTAATTGAASERVLLGEFTMDWGREAAETLLREGVPDGIVCGNDLIALGVVQRLRSAGLSVPGQVAVVGYDDIGFAEICSPPLTTVRQPVDDLGAAAVRLLNARQLDPSGVPRVLRLKPELVIRESTPPLKSPKARRPASSAGASSAHHTARRSP